MLPKEKGISVTKEEFDDFFYFIVEEEIRKELTKTREELEGNQSNFMMDFMNVGKEHGDKYVDLEFNKGENDKISKETMIEKLLNIKEVLIEGAVHNKIKAKIQEIYHRTCGSLLLLREIIGKELFGQDKYLVQNSKDAFKTLELNDELSFFGFYLQLRQMVGESSTDLKEYVLSPKYFDARKIAPLITEFVLKNAYDAILISVSAFNCWRKFASFKNDGEENSHSNKLARKGLFQELRTTTDLDLFAKLASNLTYYEKLNLMYSMRFQTRWIKRYYSSIITVKPRHIRKNPATFYY